MKIAALSLEGAEGPRQLKLATSVPCPGGGCLLLVALRLRSSESETTKASELTVVIRGCREKYTSSDCETGCRRASGSKVCLAAASSPVKREVCGRREMRTAEDKRPEKFWRRNLARDRQGPGLLFTRPSVTPCLGCWLGMHPRLCCPTSCVLGTRECPTGEHALMPGPSQPRSPPQTHHSTPSRGPTSTWISSGLT